MTLSPLRFIANELQLIDQRLLPHQEVWVSCCNAEQAARAIKDMVVRGAPAIGCAAAYGLVVDSFFYQKEHPTWSEYKPRFNKACEILASSRPTAFNLFYALDYMKKQSESIAAHESLSVVGTQLKNAADYLFNEDLARCRAIGKHIARRAPQHKPRLNILTHCNAGALATAGYGTALGGIRALWEEKRVAKVFVDETRPYWQGSRLTAYELVQEKIPHEIIVDSCAAFLMQKQQIDLIIVGADRITACGDVANKIGTYQLAVLAHYHKIPFIVAAPLSTFDGSLQSGSDIPIELRSEEEIKSFRGQAIAPIESPAYNPSFDVTPYGLISAIIHENGEYDPAKGLCLQA